MYGFPVLYKDGILGEANEEKREGWKLVRQNSEPKLKPEVTLAVNYLDKSNNIIHYKNCVIFKRKEAEQNGNTIVFSLLNYVSSGRFGSSGKAVFNCTVLTIDKVVVSTSITDTCIASANGGFFIIRSNNSGDSVTKE